MPAMKPTTRTMNGKKAFQEVVEYSRDSISFENAFFSAASILTPRRFMSIVMRMADITKMEPRRDETKDIEKAVADACGSENGNLSRVREASKIADVACVGDDTGGLIWLDAKADGGRTSNDSGDHGLREAGERR